MKSDFGNKWLRGYLLKWGELKNRKWVNAHLILAPDLKLSQALDLGIPQKSLRVRLKEEKRENIIQCFMNILKEGEEERKWDLWAVSWRRAKPWHTYWGSIQQIRTPSRHIVQGIFLACFSRQNRTSTLAHIPRHSYSSFGTDIEVYLLSFLWKKFQGSP